MTPLTTHPTHTPNTQRLAWVDVIKGLAILWIVLYHIVIAIADIPPFDHPKDTWAPLAERIAYLRPRSSGGMVTSVVLNGLRYAGWLGYQGVSLFIIASGFVLAWSQAQRVASGRAGLWHFYARRALRVYPLYWSGHLVILVLHWLSGQPDVSLTDGRFYLSLAGARITPGTFFYGSPAFWYVWLALQLYLAFPILWRWLERFGLKWFWVGTAAITIVSRFLLLVVVGSNVEQWSMGAIFVARLFEFTFGIGLAYRLREEPAALDRLARKGRVLALAGLVYAVGLALSITVVGSVVAHSMIGVGLFVLSYFFVQYGVSRLAQLERLLVWVGGRSYALMIIHQPLLWGFIGAFRGRLSSPLLAAAACALVPPLVLAAAGLTSLVDALTRLPWAALVAWVRGSVSRSTDERKAHA